MMITTANRVPYSVRCRRKSNSCYSEIPPVRWGNAQLFIKQRHVRNCYKADPAYGKGVAEALGISLEEALKEDR